MDSEADLFGNDVDHNVFFNLLPLPDDHWDLLPMPPHSPSVEAPADDEVSSASTAVNVGSNPAPSPAPATALTHD
eukprot:2062867-Rhodomonas_salina.1